MTKTAVAIINLLTWNWILKKDEESENVNWSPAHLPMENTCETHTHTHKLDMFVTSAKNKAAQLTMLVRTMKKNRRTKSISLGLANGV